MEIISDSNIKLVVQDVHSYVTSLTSKESLSYQVLANLSECQVGIEALLNNSFLLPHEKVILERDCKKITSKVWLGSNIFYFSSFYYAYKKIKEGDEPEIQTHFAKINLDISAMRLNIKATIKDGSDLGCSEDNCFFSRIERCDWAFKFVLNNELNAQYSLSLYCMCNLLQTLFLYTKNVHGKYEKKCINEINRIISTLILFLEKGDIKELLQDNIQLHCFICEQIYQYNSIFDQSLEFDLTNISIPDTSRPRSVLRILTNMKEIMPEMFISLFEKSYSNFITNYDNWDIMDKALFLRIASNYLYLTFQKDLSITLDIYEIMENINVDDILNQVFSLNQIDMLSVTEEQIRILQSFKDDVLRKKVSNTMKGIRPDILERESIKPHGSFEISDMEVPITYQGKQLHMCLPFKSGVEISEKSVPVNVAYQIVRPFTEFDQCIVVFITAKRCSENLMNQVKKLKDKMKWPIGIIEEKALAALLHLNNQL